MGDRNQDKLWLTFLWVVDLHIQTSHRSVMGDNHWYPLVDIECPESAGTLFPLLFSLQMFTSYNKAYGAHEQYIFVVNLWLNVQFAKNKTRTQENKII